MSTTHERTMNIRDVAAHLQVSERTVQKWIRKGCPATLRGMRIWRLNPAEVKGWLVDRQPKIAE